MSYATLIIETAGEIAQITLNRPDKRNALSVQMIEELFAALDDLESAATRVVIITGAGKAFCSGMDLDALKNIATQSASANMEDSRRMARFFLRLWSYPKPLIAAVNGPALAGGCGLATLCDFTLASHDAKFGYTEARIGFIAALVSVFLERQVGERAARDLLLTAQVIDAEEAHRIGLATRVVPAEQLLPTAYEFAAQLIANSPASLAATKRLLVRSSQDEVARRIELAVAENAEIRSTADFREGLAAFLEKRKPRWSY